LFLSPLSSGHHYTLYIHSPSSPPFKTTDALSSSAYLGQAPSANTPHEALIQYPSSAGVLEAW
jgi:hypothetical protein